MTDSSTLVMMLLLAQLALAKRRALSQVRRCVVAALLLAVLTVAADTTIAPPVANPVPRSSDWWRYTVPDLRARHHRRFARAFRVPPRVFDSIVASTAASPFFAPSASNVSTFLDPSLQVGIALWRFGRTVSVYDVADKFGVSEVREVTSDCVA